MESSTIGTGTERNMSVLTRTRRMPPIRRIAYGPGVRKFRIRNKKTKDIVLDFEHESCCLYVMQGDFQVEFTNDIPVQKKVKGERISLTFRHHRE
jgi:hypothetical protein